MIVASSAWSADTQGSKHKIFHEKIETVVNELSAMYGGRVEDLGQSFIMTGSDNYVDTSSVMLKKLISEVSGFEADTFSISHQQYIKFLSILNLLIEKLHSKNAQEAGSHEVEQDINNFIIVSKLIGDFQKYDPTATEIKELLSLTQSISASLERLIKSNGVSPFVLDYFDDIDKNVVADYIALIERKQHVLDSSLYENREVIRGGFPEKEYIVLAEDKHGNLIITIGGARGLADLAYDLDKQIAFSSMFQLNGVSSAFKNAEFYYDLLEKHFAAKNRDKGSLESYLAGGKKIRLIGHGFDGIAAEIITHKLKLKYAFENHTIVSDRNQIQAVTFGAFGYLDKSSVRQFKEKVGKNILRFRFAKDAIADYSGTGKLEEVFIVKDAVKNNPYSSTYHELQYFQGNLINVNVVKNFKRYVLLYKLLKSEHEVLSAIADKKDNQEIAYYLTQLNNLKKSILSYYYSSGNQDQLGLFSTIKISCGALADVIQKSAKESAVIESIADMVATKEILVKRNSLKYEGVIGDDAVVKNVLTQINNLKSDDAPKAFRAIIAGIGQSPEMLMNYASFIKRQHDIDTVKALLDFLISVERKARAHQLDGIKEENKERLQKYLTALAMSKLNLLVGGKFKEAGGATGTKFTLDIYGKVIGIFKPQGQNAVIKQYFGQAALLSNHKLAQPIAECAAYKLSLDLQLDLAPITIMTTMMVAGAEVEGAFMELLTDFRAIDEVMTNREPSQFNRDEIKRFQYMAIFDFMIANLDRHLDNLFISKNGYDLTTLKCIDNANAFITCGPNLVSGHNMYLWGSYKVALAQFDSKVIDWVKSITHEELEAFKSYMAATHPRFLSKDILAFFDLRVKALKSLSVDDSPADLAKLKTRTNIEEWLSKRGKQ